jgi:hypothetical protein
VRDRNLETFSRLDEYGQNVGSQLGYSRWQMIAEKQINLFTEATTSDEPKMARNLLTSRQEVTARLNRSHS